MKARFVLALDQGTTSSRAILFDREGLPAATAQREHAQQYPEDAWFEHDAEEIFANQLAVAEEVLTEAGVDSLAEIAALGITNQRETTVVWDRATGVPIHPAIVWQDRRTASFCEELIADGYEAVFREKTGLRLDPYFSGTKLRWILDHVDGARERAEAGELAFGTIDTWLTWQLTDGAVHVTDLSNASRTLLVNLETVRWDAELLEILDIPVEVLPEIVPSSGVIGEVAASVSTQLGGLPIAGIAGDQQAALFGQACFDKGMAKNTYGTGCFLLMHTGSELVRSENNLLTTVAWQIGDRIEYALEGSVFIGGAVVQWLRDEMELFDSAPEVNDLAKTVPDSGGVVLVPAFAGLGAPHWDPLARGAVFGMTRATNRGHFARAALESIAFQVADLIEAMEADCGVALQELRVDGGAARSDVLLQFQSDLLGVDVVRPRFVETTALGAACLAGLAVGFWTDRQSIASQWAEGDRISPKLSKDEMAGHVMQWRKAVERSRGWAEEG